MDHILRIFDLDTGSQLWLLIKITWGKKNSDDEALLPSNYLYSVWDWTQATLVFQASQRTLT